MILVLWQRYVGSEVADDRRIQLAAASTNTMSQT